MKKVIPFFNTELLENEYNKYGGGCSMIRIVLGNIGSGKTAMVVREMLMSEMPIYSNIITKSVKSNHTIEKGNIIKEEVISVKKDGTEVKKFTLNKEYWQELRKKNETISVIIDEAHTLINPRRAMSKKTEVMTDFMALLRRILGSSDTGYGELILISQLERRLDVIAREMATIVQYCVCHYERHCKKCGHIANETNESPSKMLICPYCGKAADRKNFQIEVYSFENMERYHSWDFARKNNERRKTFYEHYFIMDIEQVFKYYDTLQWENLISD